MSSKPTNPMSTTNPMKKKVSIWFKIWVRVKWKIIHPLDCLLAGHNEFSYKEITFCPHCLKKLN